jgi:(2Fe-2S) ferredoxin
MSHYKHHVFFCTNQREGRNKCCANDGAVDMLEYARKKNKELKLNGPGKNRINASACLDRCTKGPIAVVYPEEVWYTYQNEADIDEIVTEHLQHGRIVERLVVPANPNGGPKE